ncbi:MAG: alpha/beta hydrolase family protein [Acidimicrobiia bacterium]|nr:alpha/beta hydrolase family protein [Acidimicrobiia bacterium]
MHWLDRIAGFFSSKGHFYDPLFVDGWGDEKLLERFQAEAGLLPDIPPIDIAWRPPTTHRDGLRYADGTFPSPAAEILPEASRLAALRRIGPPGLSAGTCLIMAAFNDHGYSTRHKLAQRLARDGLTSLLLENPYYGSRRPTSGQTLRTVVDFFAMGSAAVFEGRSILADLHHRGEAPIGIAGYSMGGNIAALISATVPFPVATAGLAASHSPGPVWAQGLLTNSIAWEALGGLKARSEIAAILGSASVLRFPAPPHASSAVLAAPAADGYIPRHAIESLNSHWPGSELRWIKGGHASVLLWKKGELARAIVDSFARLRQSDGRKPA